MLVQKKPPSFLRGCLDMTITVEAAHTLDGNWWTWGVSNLPSLDYF